MNKLFLSTIIILGFLGSAVNGYAQPIEYVKICSLYGAGYHYISGTDICLNEWTGETRQATNAGIWSSLLPTNNQGQWVTNLHQECGDGRLVKVGAVKPADFKPNSFGKFQAAPFDLKLQDGEFISKVMMSGGFYDPLQPSARDPRLSPQQFCLRVADPSFFTIDMGGTAIYPGFCNAAPLACVSNSQILNTPAAYSFTVLGAPVVHYNTDKNGKVMGAPKTCGSQLVFTTGMGPYNPTVISDPSQPSAIPAAGKLSAWVCIVGGASRFQDDQP